MQNLLRTQATPTSTAYPASVDVSSSARISLPPTSGAATSRPAQVQPATLARTHTEAPESVFSAPGQSPDDSGDAQPGQQRPATPTEQRAEGQRSAAHAKRPGARPAPSKPAPARDRYTRHRDADQPSDTWCDQRGEFVQATGPPATAPSKRARVPFGGPPF